METRWLIEDLVCAQTMGSVLYFEQFKADEKTPDAMLRRPPGHGV